MEVVEGFVGFDSSASVHQQEGGMKHEGVVMVTRGGVLASELDMCPLVLVDTEHVHLLHALHCIVLATCTPTPILILVPHLEDELLLGFSLLCCFYLPLILHLIHFLLVIPMMDEQVLALDKDQTGA